MCKEKSKSNIIIENVVIKILIKLKLFLSKKNLITLNIINKKPIKPNSPRYSNMSAWT